MTDDQNTIDNAFAENERADSPQASGLNTGQFLTKIFIGLAIIATCVICTVLVLSSKLGEETLKAENSRLKQQLTSSGNSPNHMPKPFYDSGWQSNGNGLASEASITPQINVAAAEEKIALSKAAVAGFKAKLSKLDSEFLSVLSLEEEIQTTCDDLRTNDIGKRIASNEELTMKYIAIVDSLAEKSEELLEIPSFVSAFQSFFEDAELNPTLGYRPSPESTDTLKRLAIATKLRNQHLTDLKFALWVIQSEAEDVRQGNSTLDEVVSAKRAEIAAEISSRIQRRVDKVRSEEAQKREDFLAEAERNQLAAEREYDGVQIEAEMLGIKKNTDQLTAEIEKRKKQAEIEARENALRAAYQREKANIQSYLTPFTADGRMLRGDLGGRGPASLSFLVSQGALQPGNRGLTELLKLGGRTYNESIASGYNDRPRGGFPYWEGMTVHDLPGRYRIDYIEKAQEYLRAYGQLMVEDGLLAK